MAAERACHTCSLAADAAAKAGRPLRRCILCRSVYYCSEDCQKKDWPSHEKTCRELAKALGERERQQLSARNAKPAGRLFLFGSGMFHLMGRGDDSSADAFFPEEVATLRDTDIIDVALGSTTVHCVSAAGVLYAHGESAVGQLGHGDAQPRAAPSVVSAFDAQTVESVASGVSHTMLVTREGRVFGLGAGELGQLGLGPRQQADQSVPRLVKELANVRIVQVACGELHTIMLSDKGRVFTCGDATRGALGLGAADGTITVPTPVHSLRGVPVTRVAAGSFHSLVSTATGGVYAWGQGKHGATGLGSLQIEWLPRRVSGQGNHLLSVMVTEVAAGGDTSMCLTAQGHVYVWGRNSRGQHGCGDRDEVPFIRHVKQHLFANEPVNMISCGGSHCMAVTDSGRVFVWGAGDNGQLGLGPAVRLAPWPAELPTPPNSEVIRIVAGPDTSALLLRIEGDMSDSPSDETAATGTATSTPEETPADGFASRRAWANDSGALVTGVRMRLDGDKASGTQLLVVPSITASSPELLQHGSHIRSPFLAVLQRRRRRQGRGVADPSKSAKRRIDVDSALQQQQQQQQQQQLASALSDAAPVAAPLLPSPPPAPEGSPSQPGTAMVDEAPAKAGEASAAAEAPPQMTSGAAFDDPEDDEEDEDEEEEEEKEEEDGQEEEKRVEETMNPRNTGEFMASSMVDEGEGEGAKMVLNGTIPNGVHYPALPAPPPVPVSTPADDLFGDSKEEEASGNASAASADSTPPRSPAPQQQVQQVQQRQAGPAAAAAVDGRQSVHRSRFRRVVTRSAFDYAELVATMRAAQLSGDYHDVVQYVLRVFGSVTTLNASFLPSLPRAYLAEREPFSDRVLTYFDGIDSDLVERCFKLLLGLKRDAVTQALYAVTRKAILQLSRAIAGASATDHILVDPACIRCVAIILQNPLFSLATPSESALVSDICGVVRRLPERGRKTLRRWFSRCYSAPIFGSRLVNMLVRNVEERLRRREPEAIVDINAIDYKIDDDVESAVELLTLLHEANEDVDGRLVAPSKFYLKDISKHVNVGLDYVVWARHALNPPTGSQLPPFTFCSRSFLLDPLTKSAVLRVENQISKFYQEQSALVPVLLFSVRRSELMYDAVTQLARFKPEALRKQLRVQFVGEDGVDMGGVAQEFFQLVSRELMKPAYRLFLYNDDTRTFWFNLELGVAEKVAVPPQGGTQRAEFSALELYRVLGVLCGMACYHGQSLSVQFPEVFYKKLLGIRPTLADLRAADPAVWQSMQRILEYKGADLEDMFGLTFCVSARDPDGRAIIYELKPGGAQLSVTLANRDEFVALYVDYVLEQAVRQQMERFREGFFSICSGVVIRNLKFSPQELEAVLCGQETLDFRALEANAVYEGGYNAQHRAVRWLWDIVHNDFSLEQKKQFLVFFSGSARSPLGGLGTLKFVVQRASGDTEHLPTAHTCFYTLLLPEYSSKEKMRAKLLAAIKHAEGFGLQ